MNPDPMVMEYIRHERERSDRVEQARRDVLHRAAVARRQKAKRGGKR